MADWISKLDDFLRLSDRDILMHANRVSIDMAKLKCGQEYECWRVRAVEAPTAVEAHLRDAVRAAKTIGSGRTKGAQKNEEALE